MDAHLGETTTQNGGGLCAASQYLLTPTHDRVTIAPGTAFFSESEVFVRFYGKTAGKKRDDGSVTNRSGLS